MLGYPATAARLELSKTPQSPLTRSVSHATPPEGCDEHIDLFFCHHAVNSLLLGHQFALQQSDPIRPVVEISFGLGLYKDLLAKVGHLLYLRSFR
jgi:hypothetical protein